MRPGSRLGLIFLLVSSAFAAAPASKVRSHLLERIPPALREFQVGRTTRDEVRKKLGPPGRESADALLYKLDTFEYDTVLTFRGPVLRSIEFRFAPKAVSLASLRLPKWEEGVDPAAGNGRVHEWGRERKITLKDERLVIIHAQDEEKSLRSVVFE